MSTSKNKAVVRRYVEEALNKGNLAVVDDCFSADWFYRSPFGEYKGPDGFKQMVTMFRKAFPDVHYTLNDMVGEGDELAVRFTMTATFKGELMGIPPTGKQINMTSAYFYRFKGGKEVEATLFSDSLAFYRQLGIPIPPG